MEMALAYAALCGLVVAFQIALIAGAPWGRFTQGGRFEGALPLQGRVVAAALTPIVVFKALAILSAAGGWPGLPFWTAWPALAVQLSVTLFNLVTPSRPERRLWGPICTVMFVLAVSVVVTA